nr:PREDICTED: atlastin isoform X2 [Megachile rotundata]
MSDKRRIPPRKRHIELSTRSRDSREIGEPRESVRQPRETRTREPRDVRDTRESRESKEFVRESREPKDFVRESREPKEFANVRESREPFGNMRESKETIREARQLRESPEFTKEPREPTRPPRTRASNGTVERNVNRAEKVPMTTLDENVNRVPRLYTNESADLGWRRRIELVSMKDDITSENTSETKSENIPESGKPVAIVLAHPDHTFELNENALAEILLQNDIKDRSVVVVSVAGAFRKGKSFLLDFFLRYMNNKYDKNNHTDSWLGNDDEPLKGFSWKGGSERDTTGILMWSKVFRGTLPDGERVAVILMDTQGAFDSQSTVKDCATVFALSTMLSSVQIYNLSQNIQEDDLQHLQLFTEYGRLALETSGRKPFQKLQFLVRDWSYPYEAKYGAEGGNQILQRRLEISDSQHPELRSLRKHIRSCFSDISCFLMPHPGLNIATNPHFDGRLSEIQPEFKQQLKVLIPMLLAPENLVTKKIDGQVVKAKDLLEYFKSYMKIYRGNELPEPKSMLVATAEANNLAAVTEAKELYMRSMEDVCGGKKPYVATVYLETEHQRCVDKAINMFQNKRKMGGDEFSQMYMRRLRKDMETAFDQFKSQNESKNVFKSARSAAVYFIIVIVAYLSSALFAFTGLYTMANICGCVVWICIVTLIVWAYIRYSGNYGQMGGLIDDVANIIWNNFMKPFYQQFAGQSMSVAMAAAEMATNSTLNATVTANGKPKMT